MSTPSQTPTPARRGGAERTRAYRARLRAQGLKPRTIWTYDTSDPAFQERLAADALKLKGDPQEKEIMKEIALLYRLDEES